LPGIRPRVDHPATQWNLAHDDLNNARNWQ